MQVGWRALLVLAPFALASCSEHEPELEREGGPIPQLESDAMPEEVELEVGEIGWCQAASVLEAVCQTCHSDPPANNAPFPLVTYEHTQAQYYTTERVIWEVMEEVVASDFMPLTTVPGVPVAPLTCEQKTTLLGWLQQGANLAGATLCTDANQTLVACDPSIGSPADAGM